MSTISCQKIAAAILLIMFTVTVGADVDGIPNIEPRVYNLDKAVSKKVCDRSIRPTTFTNDENQKVLQLSARLVYTWAEYRSHFAPPPCIEDSVQTITHHGTTSIAIKDTHTEACSKDMPEDHFRETLTLKDGHEIEMKLEKLKKLAPGKYVVESKKPVVKCVWR